MRATSNKIVGWTQRVQPLLVKTFGIVSAVFLIAMMLLMGVDVIFRYLFNAPVKGAFELTEILLVGLVFTALPLTTAAREHIEVELFEPKSPRVRQAMNLLATFCGIVVFSVLAFEIWAHANRMAKYGEVTHSLHIPLSVVGYAVAGCCAVCVLLLVLVRSSRLGDPG